MRKLFCAFILASTFTVGVSFGTVITITPGPNCTGGNTPSCPGPLDVFSGDAGVFLAGAVAQLQQVGGPFNLPSTGTLNSAVFREGSGRIGFYYQIALNQSSSALQEFTFFNSSLPVPLSFSGADVGIRTDGLGSLGPAAFVPASHRFAEVYLSQGGGSFPFLNVSFRGDNLQPGETSVTLAVFFNAGDYSRNGVVDLTTATQPNGVDYRYFARGDVLVPTPVPEPTTWALMSAGAIVAALLFRRSGGTAAV